MNYVDKLSEVLQNKYSRQYNTLVVFEKLKEDLKELNQRFELYFKASNNSIIDFEPKIAKCGERPVDSFDKISVTIDGLERLIVCEIHTDYPGIFIYEPDYGRPILRIKPDGVDSVTILEFKEKIQTKDLLEIIIGNVFLTPNQY